MTTDDDPPTFRDDDGTIRESFHDTVQQLVTEATEHGVDVYGRWPVAGGNQNIVWEVEIRRVDQGTRTRVDDSISLITAITDAVAERENIDWTALPPLYEVIDPEVLKSLFQSENDQTTVTFSYCGYQVSVRADGTIFIDE